jgi:hypothetical protein
MSQFPWSGVFVPSSAVAAANLTLQEWEFRAKIGDSAGNA